VNPGTERVIGLARPRAARGIDAFVESALERYDVPGVAIALIKDG
jgi:hypothetical protein